MPNTSASGGYLQPTSPLLVEGADLDAVLQTMVVGVSGLPGTMVRPRWQPTPLPEPPRNVDWCGIGVIDEEPETNATVRHFPGSPANYWDRTGDGFDQEQRQIKLSIMASFYGPNSRAMANLFRDGLYIAQNREQLLLNGIAFIDVTSLRGAPELVNNVWRQRTDLTFRLRRQIIRTYSIDNVLSAAGDIVTERGTEPFDTANVRE